MRIALAADHAGFLYEQRIAELLAERGHDAVDFGTHSTDSVDYPDFIAPAARAVAANRFAEVRCALCWSVESAELSRRHNDANVLSIGARLLPWDLARAVVLAWLATPFDGGRHARRVRLIESVAASS